MNDNKELETECQQCGHKWFSRTQTPLSCPRCKRYDWNKDYEEEEEVKDSEIKEKWEDMTK